MARKTLLSRTTDDRGTQPPNCSSRMYTTWARSEYPDMLGGSLRAGRLMPSLFWFVASSDESTSVATTAPGGSEKSSSSAFMPLLDLSEGLPLVALVVDLLPAVFLLLSALLSPLETIFSDFLAGFLLSGVLEGLTCLGFPLGCSEADERNGMK
ncbi:hypothetical protein ColKHC_06674 [Colletotrichum higginsianum]|nr:hypothetical protein ColKHC_06674 [Colletotrichum higginsianum]